MKASAVESLEAGDLNRTVAALEGWTLSERVGSYWFHPTTCDTRPDGALQFTEDWALAGPIIERHCITLVCAEGLWYAETHGDSPLVADAPFRDKRPLVAAMRAYVARRLSVV